MSKIKSLIKKILVDRKALYITLALILLAAAIPTALILSSSKKADEKPAVSELTDKSSSTYSTPDSSDKVATTEALKPPVEAEPKATSEPAATADAGTVTKTASNGTSSTGTTGSSSNTQPAQPAKQTTAPTPVSYTYGNTSG
ncbi:MAG: hypothetical protein Q8930_11445, partial [Bacillota bacterium]|nr:hypothetical protein [Bacillota bacterium]